MDIAPNAPKFQFEEEPSMRPIGLTDKRGDVSIVLQGKDMNAFLLRRMLDGVSVEVDRDVFIRHLEKLF